ncbi:hypothetical protein FISHEDRAFT_70864 [Fistulina hepatica ATCC 64428]|uniref:Membrane-associated proteins in eicosanoid and glutathione metabolism n=1 Tax=Fistulina hepatica ATCC 64428 TaxID=1128425 RepID=A0A0D7AIV0_9AGAR|nr:hypothetical protein FISHEDRAFT_70864 [Fistulina hepatica ATCC 64428]
MPFTLVLPDGFQYVGIGLISTGWVLMGQVLLVGKHRKRSGIPYPRLYAEKSEQEASREALIFNCAQRLQSSALGRGCHQNSLEALPLLLPAALVTALKYPLVSAVGLVAWSLSRIPYTIGYMSGDVDKRTSNGSAFGSIAKMALLLTGTYVAASMALDL